MARSAAHEGMAPETLEVSVHAFRAVNIVRPLSLLRLLLTQGVVLCRVKKMLLLIARMIESGGCAL